MDVRKATITCLCIILSAKLVKGDFIEGLPPHIYEQPGKDVYFKPNSSVNLPCQATGHQTSVQWYKESVEIDPAIKNTHTSLRTDGSLTLSNADRSDEGIYQCRASNSFGVSISLKSVLREAKLDSFFPEPDQYHYLQLGAPLTLRCLPPFGIPMPEIFWATYDRIGRIFPIEMSSRVTTDYFGNLRFANVKREDAMKEYKKYYCVAKNRFLRSIKVGHGHIIRPQGVTPLSFKPDYMWSSPSETLGMRGEMLKLKCIFSGKIMRVNTYNMVKQNPTPIVNWSLPFPADASRVMYSTGGQEISIDDIQESDEGVYTCTGSSIIEGESYSQSRSINVRIESEPRFTIRPNNVFLDSGDSVSFLCKAEGKPVPTIEWFVNGVNLQDTTHPIIHSDRFLHPDAYNMTFVDVRKEESMCIQCNASNKHGYVFADVFLSVVPQE